MRHNFANLLKNIARRHTKIQQEELEAEVTGSSWCYSEEIDEVEYGELWAYIDQTWHSQDDTGSVAGYKYAPYGLGIGYDKHFDEWIVGGVLRYDNGKMKLKSGGETHTDVETLLASAYVSWANDGYYLSGGAHLGYGWNESVSSYTMPGLVSKGKGKYHSSLYGVNAEGGYMFNTGSLDYPLRITPYGGLAYARINRDGFHEKGAGNLNRRFYSTDWDMWDATAGVRVSMPLQREGYTLIPSMDISIVRTLGEPEANHNDVTLISNPLGSWKVDTLGGNRTALRVGAGLNARFNRLDVGAAYEFEWRKKATAHQLNLNMSLGF
jgi:outer membrane autotransporter protein